MNCELMLTYDTPALRQTGSRNLTGQKPLPTIWGTYMKLVTKYQISSINSCWEKCDEKWAYMFNVYKKSTKSAPIDFQGQRSRLQGLLYPRSLKGEGDILFYLCPSFRPSNIFFVTFFSVTVDDQISSINSCWEKCDEKWAYMFNVYKKSTKSANRK
jgi:hypothetical protein